MTFRQSAPVVRLALVAAAASALAIASPAAAAGPVHTKIEDFTLVFPAGLACDFPVEWAITTNGNNQLVFAPRKNGDQVTRQTGTNITTATNLDTGASVSLRGGFRLDIVAHADGNLTIEGRGAIISALFPTDVGGPGMFWFRGHLTDQADSGFNVTAHEFVGHADDLCAALSG